LERLFSVLLWQSLNLSLKPHLMQMHITMEATTTKVIMVVVDMVEVITMGKEMPSLKLIQKPTTTTIINTLPKAMDILMDTDTTKGLQNLMLT